MVFREEKRQVLYADIIDDKFLYTIIRQGFHEN
jgi:hypothetical protein